MEAEKMKSSGVIPLGLDRYVEVFTVEREFELWMVEGERREYIGKVSDMQEARKVIEKKISPGKGL